MLTPNCNQFLVTKCLVEFGPKIGPSVTEVVNRKIAGIASQLKFGTYVFTFPNYVFQHLILTHRNHAVICHNNDTKSVVQFLLMVVDIFFHSYFVLIKNTKPASMSLHSLSTKSLSQFLPKLRMRCVLMIYTQSGWPTDRQTDSTSVHIISISMTGMALADREQLTAQLATLVVDSPTATLGTPLTRRRLGLRWTTACWLVCNKALITSNEYHRLIQRIYRGLLSQQHWCYWPVRSGQKVLCTA